MPNAPSRTSSSLRTAAGRATDALATRLLGLPPVTTDYTVSRGIRVPMRDGVELAADLYQPRSDAVGTLLIRGPYGRHLPLALPLARVFAARGYYALFVSSRGTFGSGGKFDPMRDEEGDGHDVVAWIIRQPWFTGTFATLGGSYLGHTQWALLADPPPELAAAVVAVGPHDFSEHVWGTGAFRLDFLGWSNQIVHQEDGAPLAVMLRSARDRARIRPVLNELPLVSPATTFLGGRAPWYVDWVTRPDAHDPFWAPMQHGVALDRVEVPVLLFGGWQDIFLEQTIHQYQRLHERGVDVAMTIGAWSHLDTVAKGLPVTTRETWEWLEVHVAKRAARRRSSPVRVYVTGAGEWRDLPTWPPQTSTTTWFLQPGRRLSLDPPAADGPPSSFTFDPADPTPTIGGPLLSTKCYVDDTGLAARPDVLSFTSAPLDGAVEVMGSPVVELAHASDNPHADVFARLSEVDRDGTSHNVTEGYLRLEPANTPGTVTLRLRNAAHRFAAGRRIRLLVAGGSHPQFARNLGTDENPGTGSVLRSARHSVSHGRGGTSRLLLPTVDT